MNYNPERIAQLKAEYPPGTRLEMISMEDPYAPIPAGTQGEVYHVDDAGQLHMKWDNGRSLAIVPEVDQFKVISYPELASDPDEEHDQQEDDTYAPQSPHEQSM